MLAPSRHRSPSPGPSRRPYYSYMPRADNLQYRSPYRPPVHRSEYAGGSYYDHSSSPDTYGPRPQIVTTRDRDTVWRFPPSRSYDVSENRAAPLSPARRFEPSESWKQSHVDHPANERYVLVSPTRHSNLIYARLERLITIFIVGVEEALIHRRNG